MFWRELGVVVELDGRRWHADPVTQQDDADKQAILEAHGLRVLRITWQQLVDDPRQTIARIRAALAR
jgi:very-short-patch-repair endonuclease